MTQNIFNWHFLCKVDLKVELCGDKWLGLMILEGHKPLTLNLKFCLWYQPLCISCHSATVWNYAVADTQRVAESIAGNDSALIQGNLFSVQVPHQFSVCWWNHTLENSILSFPDGEVSKFRYEFYHSWGWKKNVFFYLTLLRLRYF